MEAKKQLVVDETVSKIYVIRYISNSVIKHTSYETRKCAIEHARYLEQQCNCTVISIFEINLWMV